MGRVIYDFGSARVVDGELYSIRVEAIDERGAWIELRSFDVLSDDHVFTNARDYAERVAKATGEHREQPHE